jgi:hypothetical protein
MPDASSIELQHRPHENVAKPIDLPCTKLKHFLKYIGYIPALGKPKCAILPCIVIHCTVNVTLKDAKNKLDTSALREWRS